MAPLARLFPEKRVGRVKISFGDDSVNNEDNFRLLKCILRELIPVRIKDDYDYFDSTYLEYTGFSTQFREISNGEIIPEYIAEVSVSGIVIFSELKVIPVREIILQKDVNPYRIRRNVLGFEKGGGRIG